MAYKVNQIVGLETIGFVVMKFSQFINFMMCNMSQNNKAATCILSVNLVMEYLTSITDES